MNFLPVILWSDLLIWLLVAGALLLGWLSSRNPPLRAAWRRVGRHRPGMAAATVAAEPSAAGLPASWMSTQWPWRASSTASRRPMRPAPRMAKEEGGSGIVVMVCPCAAGEARARCMGTKRGCAA